MWLGNLLKGSAKVAPARDAKVAPEGAAFATSRHPQVPPSPDPFKGNYGAALEFAIKSGRVDVNNVLKELEITGADLMRGLRFGLENEASIEIMDLLFNRLHLHKFIPHIHEIREIKSNQSGYNYIKFLEQKITKLNFAQARAKRRARHSPGGDLYAAAANPIDTPANNTRRRTQGPWTLSWPEDLRDAAYQRDMEGP